ncbi:unnamed protein product [Thelazia callipaeda]|uniref:DUF3342 domain-containing protein n=1 Tax=Thelazia callipaeda TaxID=103827 RepID=A0A0N5CQY6_THECL|nr:unnamed protein product [Thelazia callipaeda]
MAPEKQIVSKKSRKRKKTKKKKPQCLRELSSEDELVKKKLAEKFKKTQRSTDDYIPCLKLIGKERMVIKNGDKHDDLLEKNQKVSLNRLIQVEFKDTHVSTRWKCALCQQRTLRSVLGDLFGPYFVHLTDTNWPTHLAKKPSKMHEKTQIFCDLWLHGPCALTAPDIYLVGNQLEGLETNIHKFWTQHCTVCSKEGAAMEDHGKYYHYPCALQKGFYCLMCIFNVYYMSYSIKLDKF